MDSTNAKAYCGAALGISPPALVDLTIAGAVAQYRLVLDPRTGRRAPDQHGGLLYMPRS